MTTILGAIFGLSFTAVSIYGLATAIHWVLGIVSAFLGN